jgi:hypothetical protein
VVDEIRLEGGLLVVSMPFDERFHFQRRFPSKAVEFFDLGRIAPLLPQRNLSVGDRIRVLAGPFADLVTTIETLPGPARIGVLIDLMGRKVRTSLPHDQVEKLD